MEFVVEEYLLGCNWEVFDWYLLFFERVESWLLIIIILLSPFSDAGGVLPVCLFLIPYFLWSILFFEVLSLIIIILFSSLSDTGGVVSACLFLIPYFLWSILFLEVLSLIIIILLSSISDAGGVLSAFFFLIPYFLWSISFEFVILSDLLWSSLLTSR